MAGQGGPASLTIGNAVLPIDLSDQFQRYVYYGLYESDFVAHLRATLRPGDVMIDPGTNIGYISAVAADRVGPQGRVISLEPSRTCFARLSGYLALPNVELLHAALYDKAGHSRFCDTPRVIARGFACLAEIEEPEDAAAYEIECLTVDGICEARSIKTLRYLKLDIEGAELAALHGARRMLEAGAIDFILVESDFDTVATEEVCGLLEGHAYRPSRPDRNGRLHPLGADQRQGRFDIIWQSPRQ
jgi:FkbM family methyltransferase